MTDPDRQPQLDLFTAAADHHEQTARQEPPSDHQRNGHDRITRPTITPACLTAEQAARYLGISRAKLYELLAEQALRSFTIGRSRRIPLTELERFISDRLT